MHNPVSIYVISDEEFQLKEGKRYTAVLKSIRGEILWVELGHVAGGHFIFTSKANGFTSKVYALKADNVGILFETQNAVFDNIHPEYQLDAYFLGEFKAHDSLGVDIEFFEDEQKVEIKWSVVSVEEKLDINEVEDEILYELA